MTKILLICSSPMLSMRLSMFLQDKEGLEFAIYRNLDSALPFEKDSLFDFVIVGSYLDKFDDTARVSEIKTVWATAKTKIILIADLDDPKQKICQRSIVNDIVYLFWHFRNRADIRRLIDQSLRPELDLEEKQDSAPKIKEESDREIRKSSGSLLGREKVPRLSPAAPVVARTPLQSESELASSEKIQALKAVTLTLSNIDRLRPPVVVIASSTGGFAALRNVISCLPDGFRAPIVIAQHMPKGFAETLVKSLNAANPHVTITLAGDGELAQRHVYVLPYDYHGVLVEEDKKLVLRLNQEPKEHSLRPAADPLFRSAAKLKYRRVVAAILTGMGSDGSLGSREIKQNGGLVICQDKESSAVWGMPRMAVEMGTCDKIAGLSEIGMLLSELTK